MKTWWLGIILISISTILNANCPCEHNTKANYNFEFIDNNQHTILINFAPNSLDEAEEVFIQALTENLALQDDNSLTFEENLKEIFSQERVRFAMRHIKNQASKADKLDFFIVAEDLSAQDRPVVAYMSFSVSGQQAKIQQFAISPSHQDCGIAKKLVFSIEKVLKEPGKLTDIDILLPKTNINQIKIFEKLGFNIIHSNPDSQASSPDFLQMHYSY